MKIKTLNRELIPYLLGDGAHQYISYDELASPFPKYYCPTVKTHRDFNKMRKSCRREIGIALVHKNILFKTDALEIRDVFFKTFKVLELIFLNYSSNYVFMTYEQGITNFIELKVYNNAPGLLLEVPFCVSWDLIIFPNEGIRDDHELFESCEDAFLYWSPDDLFSKTRSENGLVLSGGREYSNSEIENANCRIKQFCDNFPVYDKKLVSEFLL